MPTREGLVPIEMPDALTPLVLTPLELLRSPAGESPHAE